MLDDLDDSDLPETKSADKPKRSRRKPKQQHDDRFSDNGHDQGKQDASTLDPATAAADYLKDGEIDGLPRLRFWRSAFHVWGQGHYLELNTSEVRGHLIQRLNRECTHLTTKITSDVLDQVKAQSLLKFRIQPPEWLDAAPNGWKADEMMAAKNGLVHLPSIANGDMSAIIPPTPKFFTPCALDYEFDSKALAPAAWINFLAELWGTDIDSINLLQEWFGYCLSCDTRQQKILMVIGPKRSGKGTLARILQAMVGRHNVAGPTLGSLATNFGLWPLLGKSVAIVSDARLGSRTDQSIIVERLLSISGEDTLTVDRKNLEPTTTKLSVRFTLLSNELPKLADSSGALAGRMLLLHLTESWYGKEDHELTDKLLAELPGILLWSIEGWKRLRDRGRFVQPESSEEMIAELESLTSPVGQFVRECCEVNASANVSRDDLYAAYQEWAKTQGREHVDEINVFGRNLRAVVPKLNTSQRRFGAHRVRHYEGITLKVEQDGTCT